VDQLLSVFQQERPGVVFLVDEYGGLEGMVTLQDVVDELLTEPLPGAGGATAAAFEADGEAPLHELANRCGRPEWVPAGPAVTIGGLIVSRLGRVPAPGEQVSVDGLRLRVLDSDGKAVRRVAVDMPTVAVDE
jgi:putative hemolysin